MDLFNILKRGSPPAPAAEERDIKNAGPDFERHLVEALSDAAFLIDGTGLVRAANRKAADALGLDPAGLPASSLLRGTGIAAAIARAAATGESATTDLDVHGRLAQQFSAHIAPFGPGGAVLVTLRDLTREQQVEKVRSDFIANASHEMRTPLAAIIGAIETLQGAAKDDAAARAIFLDAMSAQAQRMKRLIDDLLALSRVEVNEHVRPAATVDLSNVARQAVSQLDAPAKAAGLAIVTEIAGGANVLGDAEELLQAAQNLIENAINHASSGKCIEVICVTSENDAVLSVRDHGEGIAAEHLPRLTERFYRVATKDGRARRGTGLGLAIVKHIVQRHRGELRITSEAGRGATFTVRIPRVRSNV